jgi:hypothetical protein
MEIKIDDIRRSQLEAAKINIRIQALKSEISERKKAFDISIAKLVDELKGLEDQLRESDSMNFRNVSVVEWTDKKTGKMYLKGLFYYYKPGASKLTSGAIHIGKLEDFPLGKGDSRAKEVAIMKAHQFISKRGYSLSK